MADTDAALLSFNAGVVSPFALGRIDLQKMKAACRIQNNLLPHVLGPCMLRPGTQFLDHTKSDLTAVKFLEFYFNASTKALLVLTPLVMRVMVSGAYITRGVVTAAVTNGNPFAAALAGWTDSDQAGAVSQLSAAGNQMELIGTGINYAYRDQQVTVNEPNTEHALRITVGAYSTVRIQVGTASGGNSYIDRVLVEGVYSLAFTPTGDFWIRLGANQTYSCYVVSILLEASGIVEIPTPWDTFDLVNVFYDQSGDVLFCAGGSGIRQRMVERLGLTVTDTRSWGIALYYAPDGPFRIPNVGPAQLAATATSGVTLINATDNIFKPGHLGALLSLTSAGQVQTANLAGASQQTGNIRVSGIGASGDAASQRVFGITITGVFVATVTLQRSLGAPGSWTDVENWTGPVLTNLDDGFNNQIIFYRLAIKAGDYTSGTAVCTLNYAGSSQTGIAQVTLVNSSVQVTANVLQQFGGTDATTDWSEGEWSSYRGFPTSVGLHEGRLFWGGSGLKIWGSVSDAFNSFDSTVIGDAGPINRSVATGGLDGVRWLLSLQRLLGGTAGQEVSIRASAFDEPLTPIAFVARPCSTRGAAAVRAIRVDMGGVFIERNAQRVFSLVFDLQKGDYRSAELTRLCQEIGAVGIIDVAIQRQPDTRLWFVLADGSCLVLTYEPEDDVIAWTTFSTAGFVKAVAVLPGTDEDEVYFAIARTINSAAVCFVERLAKRSECMGGVQNKTIDCHVAYTGVATNTITAAHLPSTSVIAWADGAPRVTQPAPIVTNGAGVATLPGAAVTNAVVGLGYLGQLQTVKLAFGAERGTALEIQKRVARVGLVMANVGWEGVKIGRDFVTMDSLPQTYKGAALVAGSVISAYDEVPGSFNGGWDSDSRVCFQIASPYSCVLMGMVLQMATNAPSPPPAPRNG